MDSRTSRITEANILKANVALDRLRVDGLTGSRLCVYFRPRVEQFDKIRPCTLGRRDVGNKREYVTGLDSAECDALEE